MELIHISIMLLTTAIVLGVVLVIHLRKLIELEERNEHDDRNH